MGLFSSKRIKGVKSKQSQVTASSPVHVMTAQSHSCLPGLTDKWLPHLIDFNHGLLGELIRVGVINRQKFEPCRFRGLNNGSCSEARAQLMNDVINASPAQKEQFLSALDRTQQSHVTNYIRHNGRRPSNTDDNWPLFKECDILIENLNRLVDLIDIECGLLDEIISAGILNEEQRAAVSANSSPERLKMKLLDIMRRKSVADYKKFIDCLVKTKQYLVVSMFDTSTAATYPPLSEVHRANLDKNQSTLVELIDTRESGLLREMESVYCLTYKQRVFVESTDNALGSTRRLLDILRRGSQSDYDNFILCLGRTEQTHVIEVLLTDRAVAVSPITARGKEFHKYERDVIKKFMDLLQNSTRERRKELLLQVGALGPANELIFMNRSHSITLFIASWSLSGLILLHDMYCNGQLASIIPQIFGELLENKLGVTIDELTWDKSGYNRCMQHLSEASGLLVYPKIYRYSSDITTNTKPPVSSSSVNRFPHELTEMLLMKTTGQLFASMKTITTNADTYTYVTLSAVCRYWWQILNCRHSNKRRLRRYFTQLCRPFAFNPRLVTSLQTGGGDVNGVVAFDGKLYVAVRGSNTIDVYDLAGRPSSSYDLIERIILPGLLNPYDLVVCSSTRCLFVSDFNARCIWRVNLLSDSNAVDQTDQSPFIPELQYVPRNMSVQSERLLVTSYAGDALYIYDINDVEGSQRINLPHYMIAYHAVETSRETFVVAHLSKWADDTRSDHTGVSELSADGHVLLVYKGHIPFSYPFYITTVEGHFLVSDCDNRQILHLNTDLELTQVLLADLHRNPFHQCYGLECGKLYLAYENSDTVTFHKV